MREARIARKMERFMLLLKCVFAFGGGFDFVRRFKLERQRLGSGSASRSRSRGPGIDVPLSSGQCTNDRTRPPKSCSESCSGCFIRPEYSVKTRPIAACTAESSRKELVPDGLLLDSLIAITDPARPDWTTLPNTKLTRFELVPDDPAETRGRPARIDIDLDAQLKPNRGFQVSLYR
jgi:hypothetical protein